MHNIERHMRLIACLAILSAVGATPLWAVSRTTPVEVTNKPLVGIESGNNIVQATQKDAWYVNIMGTPNFNVANSPTVKIDGTTNTVKIDGTTNTVKIDATTNTVKAAQSGTWSVVLTGTPAVAQSGPWNVGINGTPNVNIANAPSVTVSNTPSVSVSNSPTVKIDATTNAVDTPTKHKAVQLWAADQSIPTGSSRTSPLIDCAGYNEVRLLLVANTASASLTACISFRAPSGAYLIAKTVNWSANTMPITCPVYGDICIITILNSIGSTVTVYQDSFAYLVN